MLIDKFTIKEKYPRFHYFQEILLVIEIKKRIFSSKNYKINIKELQIPITPNNIIKGFNIIDTYADIKPKLIGEIELINNIQTPETQTPQSSMGGKKYNRKSYKRYNMKTHKKYNKKTHKFSPNHNA